MLAAVWRGFTTPRHKHSQLGGSAFVTDFTNFACQSSTANIVKHSMDQSNTASQYMKVGVGWRGGTRGWGSPSEDK